MQQSSISALFGALSNETRLNLIANNLANVNTAGYKADSVSFQDTFKRMATDYNPDPRADLSQKLLLPNAMIVAKPRLAEQTIDMAQGPMETTGNTFDLAISGPGFFQVRTPDGIMLTRNGQFIRDAQGQLVTSQGYPLMGGGNPVQVPDTPNPVVVMPDGNVLVDNQQVAAIDIVTADPKSLQKLGGNFFTGQNKTAPVTAPAQPDQTKVYQGFLEKPNVQVVTEMVSMIETQRSFEAYAKIISTTQDMDNSAVTKVGSTS